MAQTYQPGKWNVTKNLFIWQFRLGGKELPEWTLAEMKTNQHFREYPIQEYYWQQKEKNIMVKIDVIPTASWKEAQEVFQGMLQEHMILQLPTVPDKMALLGDVAYTGPSGEIRNLLFLRANMIVRLNSIGPERVAVGHLAFDMDNLFTRKNEPGERKTKPEIRSFEAGRGETPAGEPVALEVRAEDPLQRPLWYRFTADNGEIAQQENSLIFTGEKSGEGKVTVQAVNMEGDVDEKSITIKVL
ncbi:hypothetical protein [Chitinophaga barathri]|uniref:Uncharacterized protein n=1 Tax=Chitinophaga barathri TaxID=1647451 RepID=A0A3N4N6P1_9BACT|nr:hypothetical protein [Chitinophaga barathri]RPD43313.1 hypothetical protein EG028_03180 [Chitinophaga barathri]